MSNVDVKIYVVTFSVTDVNLPALNQYLFDSADIIAFWNYVPLVYCVKSRLTAAELAIKLSPFFPNGNFFVAEVNRFNMNGVLPKPAWDWFYLHHHEKHRAPAPVKLGNALTGAFGVSPFAPTLGGLAGLLNPPPPRKK
jgi:hypothetical protein